MTAGRPETLTGAAYDSAFLEAAGLITTGGPSAGDITPEAEPAAKVAMGFLMIFGRLEIVAILYIFLPRLSP